MTKAVTSASLRTPKGAWVTAAKHSHVLPGFGEAIVLGKFQCPACRSVHNGISAAHAQRVVAATNEYLATLSENEISSWYGARIITIDPFTKCFFCDTPSSDFVALNGIANTTSASHQAVIIEDLSVSVSPLSQGSSVELRGR